jgi:hypothetical protein
MATDLDIKVKVDSSQVDQAAQKVQNTKKLFEGSPISIKYDIDGKALDVVIDKEVNLRQQTKLLFAELQKLSQAGKENTTEFQLLSATYNDSKDQLERVDAKSRDLFATLSLIPGPIGEIAGKLNGAIGLLKTFSSFKISDVKAQFKGLVGDLTDIINGFYGIKKASKDASDASTASVKNQTGAIEANTDAQSDNNQTIDEGNAATNAGTSANLKQTEVIKGQTEAYTGRQIAMAKSIISAEEFIAQEEKATNILRQNLAGQKAHMMTMYESNEADSEAFKNRYKLFELNKRELIQRERALDVEKENVAGIKSELATQLELDKVTRKQINTIAASTASTQANTAAVGENTISKEVNTTVQKGYNAAVSTGTFLTNAFSLALKGIGIGLIIAALAAVIDKLYEFGKSFFVADERLKIFKDSLQKGAEAAGTAKNKILEVGVAFKEASKGAITKEKALKIYNETLGSTIGEAKTLEEAELLYKNNTAAYIKSTGLRAEAQALYAVAAQKASEAVIAEERGFWSFDRGFFQGYDAELKKRKAKLEKDATELRAKADNLVAESLKAEVGFKPKEEKKTGETKKPEVKPLQDEELLKRAKELGAALIDDKKQNELELLEIAKDAEKKEIEALNISDKNKAVRAAALIALENKYQIERKAIKAKYLKEEEDKAEAFAKKLSDISTATITDDLEKAKQERENKFKDDQIALEKDLEFIKLSEETKNHYRLQLKEAYDNDVEKLETDAAIKSLENQKAIDESRLRIFEMNMDQSNAMRLGYINQYFAQQQKVEEDNYQIELKRNKNNKEALLRVEQEHSANVAAIKEAERRQKWDIYQQGADDLANVFAAESDLQKGAIVLKQTLLAIELGIEISKTIAFSKLALARSKVAVIEGSAQTAKIGFPQNVIPLALYAIQAALIVTSIIKATKAADAAAGAGGNAVPTAGKNYGKGGIIEGPSHSSAAGGTIINAEGGEAVMTKGAVTAFRPLLSMLNQMGGGTAFGGGVVGQGPFDNPESADKSMEPQIIKTYIVERDLTSIQERQARLKSLSTL